MTRKRKPALAGEIPLATDAAPPEEPAPTLLAFQPLRRTRWSYEVRWLRISHERPEAALRDLLDDLGRDGWELVSFRDDVRPERRGGIPTGEVVHVRGLQCFLKREEPQ